MQRNGSEHVFDAVVTKTGASRICQTVRIVWYICLFLLIHIPTQVTVVEVENPNLFERFFFFWKNLCAEQDKVLL